MFTPRTGNQGQLHTERWLLTYADLITLLVCFFVVMYSYAQADAEKFKVLSLSMQQAFGQGAVAQDNGMPITQALPADGGAEILGTPGGGGTQPAKLDKVALYNQLSKQLERVAGGLGLGDSVSVQRTDDGVRVRIDGNVIFASSKAELTLQALTILDGVAEVLAAIPNKVRV